MKNRLPLHFLACSFIAASPLAGQETTPPPTDAAAATPVATKTMQEFADDMQTQMRAMQETIAKQQALIEKLLKEKETAQISAAAVPPPASGGLDAPLPQGGGSAEAGILQGIGTGGALDQQLSPEPPAPPAAQRTLFVPPPAPFKNLVEMEMIWLPKTEKGGGFWAGKFEVTQQEYERVASANPSQFPGDRRPVENVTWEDSVKFCIGLNRIERARADHWMHADYAYTLPTAVEWAYLAGDATFETGVFSYKQKLKMPAVVGTKEANGRGLYDVLGNLQEWCRDKRYDEVMNDPQLVRKNRKELSGDLMGDGRAVRGGDWRLRGPKDLFTQKNTVRRLRYDDKNASTGFRVILLPRPPKPVVPGPATSPILAPK